MIGAMAELSTLPPSPPALSEPLPPALLPKADPPSDPAPPVPKSSLYGNKSPTAANLPPSPSKAAPENSAQTPPPPPELGKDAKPPGNDVQAPPPRSDLSKDGNPTGNHLNTAATETRHAHRPASPENTPNLYPSVQVQVSPNPGNDVSKDQPQIAPLTDFKQAQQEVSQTSQLVTQGETEKHEEEVRNEVTEKVMKEETEEATHEVTQKIMKEELKEVKQEVAPKSETPNPSTPQKPSGGPESSPAPTVPSINEPSGADSSAPPHPVHPAPDTLSYLESASLMSGTLESLSGLGEDGSSVGSDSEINGLAVRRTDKYGFLGGTQYSESGEKEVRVEVSRQREIKWLDMFTHWDKWVKQRFQKVKMRCRKGVPSSLRARAWQLLSNSHELLQANPGKFEELEREQGEPKWLDIIEKDLHRQFPFHEMFAARGGHGQQDLYRILKAYTVYRPDEGYCQAQAPVAAVLLMHMPAEQAFWCLVQICEKYLPGYYSAGLEAIQLDGEIFFSLLRRTCPMAYRHLKKFKIDPILYMTEWFMCIFSRTLPWASVLRVWDMFFCEGVKIVFRVGLVLLKQMLGSVDKLRELQGMYETMERLRNITPDLIREDVLVQEIVTLPVTEALIERECGVQVRKWRESRGELTHQPGRRLHGTRHIYEHKRRASSLASGGSFSFLGSPVPPPGPLRASSSLLSLPGFRRSKAPFQTQPKKGSISGPSRVDSPPQSPPGLGPVMSSKPPVPPQKMHPQSPLAMNATTAKPPAPQNTLSPSPKIVSEQITPKIPSPTANNAPLPPCEAKRDTPVAKPDPETATATAANEDDAKKGAKRSKEEKKKEKDEERKRQKEKRDKEKAEKERAKKERERQERERKRSGKKKQQQQQQPGGGGGATAAGEDTA